MSNLVSSGLFILVLCIIYSRSVSKDALALLSHDEKRKLAENFSGFGWLTQMPLVGIFFCYFLIKYLKPSFSTIAFILLNMVFLLFLFVTSARIMQKMKASNLPAPYIKKYGQSRWIYNLGFAACGGILVYELFI
jgi:hypothetical protein